MSQSLQDVIVQYSSDLAIEAEHIHRGQGIDPDHLNARSPQLVQLAQRAVEIGKSVIEPIAVYRRLEVVEFQHERSHINEEHVLHGSLIVQHMAGVNAVFVVLCTIGNIIDSAIKAALESDPALALALDGYGSAAVETFANILCQQFEHEAAERAIQTSIPLSPGMIG